MLRPLVAEKHVKDARKRGGGNGLELAGIRCLERPLAQAMAPGLELPEKGFGLHIPGGINLHPRSYLDALWLACENFAVNAGGGTRAALVNQRVSSLVQLSREGYEAVVVCMGSKAVLLPELAGKLPLSMCRGVVAHLELPSEYEEYHSQAPNLLTHTWLAVQGAREMVLGATKDWSSASECRAVSAEERISVRDELLQRAAQFYPLIKQWEVKSLRAGVRAMLHVSQYCTKLVELLRNERCIPCCHSSSNAFTKPAMIYKSSRSKPTDQPPLGLGLQRLYQLINAACQERGYSETRNCGKKIKNKDVKKNYK